jgi:hypothetical protein
LRPNTAPGGGAPSASAALSGYIDAITRLNATELCRLQFYVDSGCVSRVALAFSRLRATRTAVTARVVSITRDTSGGTAIVQTTDRTGSKQTTRRDCVGFGSRGERWFIGTAD